MTSGPPHSTSPFDRLAVAETYDEWFETAYGRLASRIQIELLVEMLGPLPRDATLLEIGCGTGWFAAEMSRRGHRVVGADRSRSMLDRARLRIPVVQGDAERLPFADRAFDASYLIAVLDFVSDPACVLREALRVTRERVAVLALAAGSYLALRRRISARRGHPIFSQARFHARDRILGFAREAGAEPFDLRTALLLPPSIAARFPGLERALSSGRVRLGGIVAFALPGSSGPGPERARR